MIKKKRKEKEENMLRNSIGMSVTRGLTHFRT